MRQTVRQRAFLLVSVLLIAVLILTLGVTFMSRRALQYRRAALWEAASQARAFAESGLEDALAKFRRDLEFPPLSKDQQAFTYSDDILDGPTRLGGFKVTLDGSKRFPPYKIWIVTSQGDTGDDPRNPMALRTLQLEIDVSKHQRGDSAFYTPSHAATNPFYYKVLDFRDLGGL